MERFDNMINHHPIDRPPVICPMHAGTTALMKASAAYYPMVQDDPVKMARLAKAGHDIARFENVRVPFDESVEVSAFGIRTGYHALQRFPQVLQHQMLRPEDVDGLQVPDPKGSGKVPVVLKAVEVLQGGMEGVPIFLGIISPLMLAMQLRGDQEALFDMQDDPGLLKGLLEKTTDFIMEYVDEAARMGVDQIVLDDPLSNSDILTMENFQRFVEPYDDHVANEMRKQGVESILHVCGRVSEKQLERMIEIDVDALSIDEQVPIATAKTVGSRRHMVVIGNVSPTKTLLMGSKESVRDATRRCIDDGVDAVAPGCSLEMNTPLENLRAMTLTAKRHVRRPSGSRRRMR
ncbi:MAG TPA: uroporphyrinogen decarboxylase family protein [Methanomassiliicoccales archaeon]|nr:uroporphyrinogen decarboxylase family protein [Methanomassiliicoccales archaeon]